MDYAIRVSHYLDPATFELSRDVILLLSGGRVAEVIVGGEVSGGLDGLAARTMDLGDALCTPGFVNSHCHLDLSHLHRQVPSGLRFHEWAPAVIAGRMVPPSLIEQGIGDGVRMAVAGGTTSILDISVKGDCAPALARHGLRGVAALEVLGWSGASAERAMQGVDEIIRAQFELERDRLGSDAGAGADPVAHEGVSFGYSPHAPYSTSAELYQHAMGRAFGEGRVCTTHAAESPEEAEFIRAGTGPLRELLARLGVDVAGFAGYGESPLTLLLRDWLAPWLHAANPQLVLVHCNYPEAGDWQWLEAAKPSVCWCPRSQAYFGHEPWPMARMLEAGVNLVLGTDSLGSNDGLDMLGEIAQAVQTVPDADMTTLFKAATVNGRNALGIDPDAADLCIWGLTSAAGDAKQALESLLRDRPPLLASFSRGNLIARSI